MIAERKFIRQLRLKTRRRSPAVRIGIGDDCAVLQLPRGHEALVTTDFSMEDVHFRRDWQSPECIGHRCLARGLSDIAAMGGQPLAAFLSLALPPRMPSAWVRRFLDGLLALAKEHRVELAGGDTSTSPQGVVADIMVLGSAKRGSVLLRSGAKPGDRIYVTGALGESAAALSLLTSGKIKRRDVIPSPRISVGRWLVEKEIASSAIDISDGLSTDLAHICEESRCGAVLHAEAIPISVAAGQLSNSLELALHGGDDYELLFTAPQNRRVPARIADVKITGIGEMRRGKGVIFVKQGRKKNLEAKGWQHFAHGEREIALSRGGSRL